MLRLRRELTCGVRSRLKGGVCNNTVCYQRAATYLHMMRRLAMKVAHLWVCVGPAMPH